MNGWVDGVEGLPILLGATGLDEPLSEEHSHSLPPIAGL